jgi:hypothetical protein
MKLPTQAQPVNRSHNKDQNHTKDNFKAISPSDQCDCNPGNRCLGLCVLGVCVGFCVSGAS